MLKQGHGTDGSENDIKELTFELEIFNQDADPEEQLLMLSNFQMTYKEKKKFVSLPL